MTKRPGGPLVIREMSQGVYVETVRGWHRVTLYLSAYKGQSYDFRDAEAAENHANEIAAHFRIPVIR